MTRQELFEININPVSKEIYKEAKEHWDHIAKPIDGLGDFENIICQLAAIQKSKLPDIASRTLIVFCADNGVVSRAVTQSDQEVTRLVAEALGENRSSASCLAKNVNAKVLAVDIAINSEPEIKGVLNKKLALGSNDFLLAPAMTEKQLLTAIETGIMLVSQQKELGDTLILTGEMGIGNTTTSTAVLAALLNIDSQEIVGRGAGLDDIKLATKRQVVNAGIEKYQELFDASLDEKNRAFEILRCLGGFDIAAMCGVYIGAAMYNLPVVMDGVISCVSALLAELFVPGVKAYMIASHSGREKGTSLVLEKLGKKPFINGDMALGEGTGALMMLSLIDNALFFYKHGNRFDENGIADYERFEG